MNQTEQSFDINTILTTLFTSLDAIRREKNIELIYDMQATIPRELRGDSDVLSRLLHALLTFVFQRTDEKEIVLSLGAPEDFLYEEFVSFCIKDTHIAKEDIVTFLNTRLGNDLAILRGKIMTDTPDDIHIEIPFKIQELRYRRHYRLPHVGMLHKKVLVICESKQVERTLAQMLRYFLYEVDAGLESYRAKGSNLALYDIAIIDQSLSTDAINDIVIEVQKKVPLKCVILLDSHLVQPSTMPCVSTHLIKPVTQESIYTLILSLYQDSNDQIASKSNETTHIVDIAKHLQTQKENVVQATAMQNPLGFTSGLQKSTEPKKELVLAILNKEEGIKNTQKMGLDYKNELKIFLDIFDKSDLYFRQIVNEKAINKIKQFCIDLEKHAKIIGAESMLKFADTVSLIFVYNKLDMLVIYPGKFHIELKKLLEEIKKELHIK